jgi:hypothetical protein
MVRTFVMSRPYNDVSIDLTSILLYDGGTRKTA